MMIKPLLLRVVVAMALFLQGIASQAKAEIVEKQRELYSECRENGALVPMSTTCCHETMDIQYSMATTAVYDGSGSTTTSIGGGTCDQVNFGDLMVMFGSYCGRRLATEEAEQQHHYHHGDIECHYDVQAHNTECAEQLREICEAHGGYLYSTNLVLECEQFNPLIHVQNNLVCLGTSCNDHDVKEYLWGSADITTNYAGMGTCRITHIKEQTRNEFERQDVENRALIVGIILASILICGVCTKLWEAQSRRRNAWVPPREPLSDEVAVSKRKQPPPSKEEKSPLKEQHQTSTFISKDPADLTSLDQLKLSPSPVDVKAMDGELA